MNLRPFLNKRVRILIFDSGVPLQYHGQITEIGESHIAFTDRYNKPLIFAIDTIKKVELEG